MNERMTGRVRPGALRSAVLLVLLGLLASGLLGGCAGGHAATMTATPGDMATMAPTAAASHDSMAMMSVAEAQALWAARPAFVSGASADTQEAYAFALSAGGAIQYMPCYCGCVGMGHRSNLDCFLRRSEGPAASGFEEHASNCDVCVQIALTTKHMLAGGSSLSEIRAAVDATYGGGDTPGTNTELPPS